VVRLDNIGTRWARTDAWTEIEAKKRQPAMRFIQIFEHRGSPRPMQRSPGDVHSSRTEKNKERGAMVLARKFPDPSERIPSILVVESELLIRLVVVNYLQECGFKVLGVANAVEAIAALESDLPIDLVLIDVKTPGEPDSFRLAQWVRTHRPGLEILMASGDSRTSQAAQELCRNEPFFADPYDLNAIVLHIRRLIDAKPPG
jgi:CheY-like chemotaxis protein